MLCLEISVRKKKIELWHKISLNSAEATDKEISNRSISLISREVVSITTTIHCTLTLVLIVTQNNKLNNGSKKLMRFIYERIHHQDKNTNLQIGYRLRLLIFFEPFHASISESYWV